jgi:hypothetical protein
MSAPLTARCSRSSNDSETKCSRLAPWMCSRYSNVNGIWLRAILQKLRLLADWVVRHGNMGRRIQLLHGDLSRLPREHTADILVVSAFPNDYFANSKFAYWRIGQNRRLC